MKGLMKHWAAAAWNRWNIATTTTEGRLPIFLFSSSIPFRPSGDNYRHYSLGRVGRVQQHTCVRNPSFFFWTPHHQLLSIDRGCVRAGRSGRYIFFLVTITIHYSVAIHLSISGRPDQKCPSCTGVILPHCWDCCTIPGTTTNRRH